MKKKNDTLPISGIFLLNKPLGLTSNAVLQKVKRLFCAKKAGHTGSLDPMATGMLPICFGEATKFCQYVLDADKCYEVTGLLGIKTNTGDAMGAVVTEVPDFSISVAELDAVLEQFKGTIQQVPSMFSALKHQGKPLYHYARAGIDIPREARTITIYDLQRHDFDGRSFSLTVTCSKGTYIRNLVEDIGERLGVGAHVTRLHRCYTAGFANESMRTMEALQDKSSDELSSYLLPMDRAVSALPSLVLNHEQVIALRHGKGVTDAIEPKQDNSGVRLYESDGRFLGLGEWQSDGLLTVRRLLAFE